MTDAMNIYDVYPRKRERVAALKAIDKALRRLEGGEWNGQRLTPQVASSALLAATAAYARSPAGQKGTKTPYPATWFNAGGYLDDPKEWYDQRQDHSPTQERLNTNQRGPSSTDLVLASKLALAAKLHPKELDVEEVYFWRETFKGVSPEILEWAFTEYLKEGKYFPKPGDITALVNQKRNLTPYYVSSLPPREDTDAEQGTPEWEEAATKARATLRRVAGLVRTTESSVGAE